MTDSVKIVGLSDLEKKMKDLGPKVQRKHMRTAVNAAARVVRDDAKTLVPVHTGTLKKAIKTKNRRERENKFRTTFSVGVFDKTNETFYWRFVEFGTKNMPANPFLRPALINSKDSALNAMRIRLTANIAKEAKGK